jgi:hypothetical protein
MTGRKRRPAVFINSGLVGKHAGSCFHAGNAGSIPVARSSWKPRSAACRRWLGRATGRCPLRQGDGSWRIVDDIFNSERSGARLRLTQALDWDVPTGSQGITNVSSKGRSGRHRSARLLLASGPGLPSLPEHASRRYLRWSIRRPQRDTLPPLTSSNLAWLQWRATVLWNGTYGVRAGGRLRYLRSRRVDERHRSGTSTSRTQTPWRIAMQRPAAPTMRQMRMFLIGRTPPRACYALLALAGGDVAGGQP